MIFADDIIGSESWEQVEKSLERRRRYALLRRGMKDLCEWEGDGLHEADIVKLDEFKIPGVNHPKQLTAHEKGEEKSAGMVEWVEMT